MKAGLTRYRFARFFKSKFPFVILIAFLSTMFWYTVVYAINRVPEEKKLGIFVECNTVEKYINREIEDAIDGLEVFDIKPYDTSLDNMWTLFQSFGYPVDYAIICSNELSLMQEELKDYFYELDNEMISTINVNNVNLKIYSYSGIKYGIKIYDQEDLNYSNSLGFSKWINFASETYPYDYYLFLNKASNKYQSFTGEGVNDLAIEGLKYLFNY